VNKTPEEFEKYIFDEALSYNNPMKIMVGGVETK